jgi:hypothetical protein
MGEPATRRSTVNRLISLVDSGNSSSQRNTLNERVQGYFPHDPDHTTILHECIGLAWSIVFSAVGARITAQLLESWLAPSVHPAPSVAEMDLTFANAIAEMESFQNSVNVAVSMESNPRHPPR